MRQSIRDVGLWEGVIGRKRGNRIEIAFGHHRIEAARRELGDTAKVALIVRDLTDEQMIQFMGRENLEDYNADFLVMLETWNAAETFSRRVAENPKPIDIAMLLGWIRKDKGNIRLADVADACKGAAKLIEGGYLMREDFADLSVKSAREICQRIVAQHEKLDQMGKTTGRPAAETKAAKDQYGKSGQFVAGQVREGKVSQRNIKGQVDVQAYRFAKDSKKKSPLLAVAANAAASAIRKMLAEDATTLKLTEFKKVFGDIESPEDFEALGRIEYELRQLKDRAQNEARAFANPDRKVVKLKDVTDV